MKDAAPDLGLTAVLPRTHPSVFFISRAIFWPMGALVALAALSL